MNLTGIAAKLEGRQYIDTIVARGEVTTIVEPGGLRETLEWLRGEDDLKFTHLSDLAGVDYPDRDPRFWLAYHLYSERFKHRLRLKVGVAGEDPRVPSVVDMFPTADWMERECFDMLGVRFEGHPHLTRILMPDDWEGHPHRKDTTLGGVPTRYKGAFIPPIDQRLGNK